MSSFIPNAARIALLLVPLFLLPPASAADVLPPHFLPGDATLAPSAADQTSPDLARGGDIFLAVWEDERASLGDKSTGTDIYAMRVDAAGVPLDTIPFLVCGAPGDQNAPQVAWNGTHWLVVWADWGVNGTSYYYSRYLRAARVTPSGEVLDPDPILVFPFGSSSTVSFTVASDGTDWAVVFQGSSAGENDLTAVRIGADGTRLDYPGSVIVEAAYYLRFNLDLAYAAGVYFLIWDDLSDTRGIRFTPDLVPLDSAPRPYGASTNGRATLASGPDGFFLTWTGSVNWVATVMGSRIDPSGLMLDPDGIPISAGTPPLSYRYPPEAVWNGRWWVVHWDSGALSLAAVTPGGRVLNPGGLQIPLSRTGPAAATGAGGLVMAHANDDAGSSDIYAIAVDPQGRPSPDRLLSVSAPAQTHVDLATDGRGAVFVFESETSGERRIVASALDARGRPRPGGPVILDTGSPVWSGPTLPAIASDGTGYLVVWSRPASAQIVGMRLASDGTPLDAAPFPIQPGYVAAVDALDGVYLVVATYRWNFEHTVVPFGMRVRGSDGMLLDGSPFIVGGSYARSPAVEAVGDRWLVAWQQNVSHDNPRASIRAAFVDADGVPGAAFLVADLLTTSAYRGPELAWDGVRTLLTYEDETISTIYTDVVARFIRADGTVEPRLDVTALPYHQLRTDVAWEGGHFVTAYQDQRNRTQGLDVLDDRADLFMSRIDETGAPIDPQGRAFAVSAGSQTHPAVLGIRGITVVAGSVFRMDAPFGSYRVGYEVLGADGNLAPVAVADADQTGGDVPFTVQFSSTGSHDPDGRVASFAWEFGDGGVSSEADPAHTYTTPGNHIATLTVTDDAGARSTTTLLVQATLPNQPPVAHASGGPLQGRAPLSVEFSARGSYDPDGPLGNIQWDFGDHGTYWGTPAYHTYTTPGEYDVVLTVWDNRQATGTDTIHVSVSAD